MVGTLSPRSHQKKGTSHPFICATVAFCIVPLSRPKFQSPICINERTPPRSIFHVGAAGESTSPWQRAVQRSPDGRFSPPWTWTRPGQRKRKSGGAMPQRRRTTRTTPGWRRAILLEWNSPHHLELLLDRSPKTHAWLSMFFSPSKPDCWPPATHSTSRKAIGRTANAVGSKDHCAAQPALPCGPTPGRR